MIGSDSELHAWCGRDDNAGVQRDTPNFSRRWYWPIALAALIFVASSRSKIAGPSIEGSDKVAHFLVYGLLATLLLRAICGDDERKRRRAAVWAAVIVSLYGVSDEWHQSFTPGRSVEVADWLADTTGGVLAAALYAGWARYRGWLELSVAFPRRREPRIEMPPPIETSSAP